MGVVGSSGGTRAVIVREAVPVRTVQQQTDVLQVPQQLVPAVAVDADTQRSVAVSSPGVQGPPGPQGDSGDGTSMVLSVNGQIGEVVLDAEDVQADPEGTAIAAASAAVALHVADPDPHPQYIDSSDVLDGGNF